MNVLLYALARLSSSATEEDGRVGAFHVTYLESNIIRGREERRVKLS